MVIILSVLVGAGFIALLWFANKAGFGLKWYEILIAAIGLAVFFFAIQNFVGAKAEFEDKAATMFFWIFVPISVILIAVSAALPIFRKVSSK
jgi:hypothetical protein